MTIVRTPVVIKRKPITIISKTGMKKTSGWYVFNRPTEAPPEASLNKSQRILWCPYCGEWRVFTKREDTGSSKCSCCFSNTNEYYVRHYNKIWFEDVPLAELKKLDIPRPNGRKQSKE
jgi:hypothetical protein